MRQNRNLKPIVTLFLLILFCFSFFPSGSFAKGTITWLTFDYPPMRITKGEQKETGIGDLAVNFLQQRLTEYHHISMEANLKRLFYTMKKEKEVCTIGIIKTAQREAFMHYSIPALIRPGLSIVMRKDRIKLFGQPDKISLAKLIENQNLTLAFDGKRSYTRQVDSILEKVKGQKNVLIREGYDLIASSLRMLAKGHIDYLIEYPSQVMYISKERNLGDQFYTVDLEEAPDYTVSHVVCPKNHWGKGLIEKVNLILERGRPTHQYRSFIEKWVDERRVNEFRAVYDDFLNLKN